MKKRIVLCADDYGQAPSISKGILELVRMQRLSAVSCMVNSIYWPTHAEWLKPFQSKLDIGMHFNLTEGKPLSTSYQQKYGQRFFPLMKLMRKTFCRQIELNIIEDECRAQMVRFETVMGRPPKFIDGHQHVHQFPIIRQALINIYQQKHYKNVYFRLVKEKAFSKNIKKWIIYFSGTRAFQRLLIRHHIPHNTYFSGIYSFSDAKKYAKLFPSFLKKIPSSGLIMCHPGLGLEEEDPIAQARALEKEYFASPKFIEDCKNQNVSINRFEIDSSNLL